MTGNGNRPLPEGFEELRDLALDLFWTWSHAGDAMWRYLDAETWRRTRNPWFILQHLPAERLAEVARNPEFQKLFDPLVTERREYLSQPSWFDGLPQGQEKPGLVAYFSMEFGLSEALPLYAGGLGILAGDYLKAASDLGMPLVGVGLLYQEGAGRQFITADGEQSETFPYNEPASLPIEPVLTASGSRLRVQLDLPGRQLSLRVWQATVGRVKLFLLDSNDLMNSAADRGITAKLYGGSQEMRFMQELVLGLGGWRALEAMGLEVDVCHLNEGHAAMVVLARTLSVMERTGLDFRQAFWAARAGNVFTTHTPVGAGFDRYAIRQLPLPAHFIGDYLARYGMRPEVIMALGRQNPEDASEPFNMTWLALRGCAQANAVSARHRVVSQQLFQPLYPRWPVHEVPVGYVTNGVHMPSWDSEWADNLWTSACGKKRWRGDELPSLSPECLTDERLWTFRAHQRSEMIDKVRNRLDHQEKLRATPTPEGALPKLDPNALTIGFARRFTAYKRATLLLHDTDRLVRLLTNADRPVQVIVAGKAHPADAAGKADVAAWVALSRRPDIAANVVFLEDYDLAIAQELVAGVDLWLNTPEPPLEACGTSGMKVLVNGGLNLSVLDGWWAEAHTPDVGWAIAPDDGYFELTKAERDARDAEELYRLLEHEVVPEFYDRDARGIPAGWVARVRKSLVTLTPRFHTSRMARDYLDVFYGKASAAYRQRLANGAALARALDDWAQHLERHWHQIHFSDVSVEQQDGEWQFCVRVYLGEIAPAQVSVQLYADAGETGASFVAEMTLGNPIPGAENACSWTGRAPEGRPASDYSIRIVPAHADAFLPGEMPLIRWQK